MPESEYEQIRRRVFDTDKARDALARVKAEERIGPIELPFRDALTQVREDYVKPVYRIEGLHIVGSFTTVSATYKCGKSTLMLNLVKSLLDGDKFLGQPVLPPEGNVAYWNLEIEQNLYLDWLKLTGLENMDRLYPLHLRGHQFPLFMPEFQDKVVDWLKRGNIECLIIDPGYKLLTGWPTKTGTIENNNDLINEATDVLMSIKDRAGVKDLFVVLHTGHNAQSGNDMHARGGSVWGGAPDHLFFMYKKRYVEGDEEIRHFFATGRMPDFDTLLLAFDPETHLYTPESNMEAVQERGWARSIVVGLAKLGDNAGAADLRKATKGVRNANFPDAVAAAVKLGYITVEREGRKEVHRLNRANNEAMSVAVVAGMEEL